jgi:DNA polymerase III subunit gamma/tau
MSIALYRKYRPQAFGDVTNQNHIKITLQNEIESDKIGHAYLFCGPRGTGKTTLARIFSKVVNCEDIKDKNEPCNGCVSCNEINDGKSMDIIEIDAASHTGVDNVRENIITNARFTPSSRKYKVFIIDEVHMLSISAFNALLKILEEPPTYVVFILATTEIHKVPNTIISRCQRFDFKKIIFNELVDRLRWICAQEGISVDEKVLGIIAKSANGCVRDAESLLEQVLSLGGKKITFEQAELIIPTNNFEVIYKLFEYIVKKQTKEAIEHINSLVVGGIDPMRFIDDFVEFVRKILIYKINNKRETLAREVEESILSSLDKLVPILTEKSLSQIIRKFIESKELFKQSYIPQLAIEIAVVDLTNTIGSAPSIAPVQEIASVQAPVVAPIVRPEPEQKEPEVKPIEEPVPEIQSNEPVIPPSQPPVEEVKIEENNVEVPPAITETQAEVPQASSPVVSGDLLTVWPQVIDKLQKDHYKIYMSIGMSKILSFENNLLVLGFKFSLQKEKIDDLVIQNELKAVIKEVLGKDVIIETKLDSSLSKADLRSGNGIAAGNSANTSNTAEDQVKNLADAFGGEVVEGV